MSECNDNQISDSYKKFNEIKPNYYERLRIRVFWTRDVLKDQQQADQSEIILHTARQVFRENTFTLDWGDTNSYDSVLPWDYPVYYGGDEDAVYSELHRLMDIATTQFGPEENRLRVIFARTDGISKAIMRVAHLPFVIVHPGRLGNVMAHEIGHACRCAHVLGSVMASCSHGSGLTNFHNIHAWEIYRSYWCTGPRPQTWWEVSHSGNSFNYSPYMWPPYDQPTRGTDTTQYQKMR